MTTETQPLTCPACDRAPELHIASAQHIIGIHIVRCSTEGCRFASYGLGRNRDNAVKDWNQLVRWIKQNAKH